MLDVIEVRKQAKGQPLLVVRYHTCPKHAVKQTNHTFASLSCVCVGTRTTPRLARAAPEAWRPCRRPSISIPRGLNSSAPILAPATSK
jgi:hypothetical protein